jgi:hypothetical protein
MTKQLNIFVENKPGKLDAIAKALSDSGIQIIAFTIQNRGDFGMFRLLVGSPEKAAVALNEKGFVCALKDIAAVSIKDKKGNLHKLTSLLLSKNVNMVDTYGFVTSSGGTGICCIEAEDLTGVKHILEKGGFKVLNESELYNL